MGTKKVAFSITMYSSIHIGRFGDPRCLRRGSNPMRGSRGRSVIGSSPSDAWVPYQAHRVYIASFLDRN